MPQFNITMRTKKQGSAIIIARYRFCLLLVKFLLDSFLTGSSKHVVNDIHPELQCRFRSGCGTIDIIFALRQIMENVCEKNQELFMVFVDLIRAFDTVNWQTLWKVLKKLGILDKMLNIIISAHEGMKVAVMIGPDTGWLM
ncbi:uncharacterized protein LOC106878854 [Octopus bimaculoides]|uniref:uncharacterized protein LOC106878854 n=1 Tax=Octopus bimaculoides TaxID=37653 RepID=UPI00071D5752|nr:uncharacterized protein LOC106878854 [Octopus bimaculoides]|eukprot:XP_014783681.1 PREDICTED: uncharacterized protein LOC106878854 [Octopus bimaculoides]